MWKDIGPSLPRQMLRYHILYWIKLDQTSAGSSSKKYQLLYMSMGYQRSFLDFWILLYDCGPCFLNLLNNWYLQDYRPLCASGISTIIRICIHLLPSRTSPFPNGVNLALVSHDSTTSPLQKLLQSLLGLIILWLYGRSSMPTRSPLVPLLSSETPSETGLCRLSMPRFCRAVRG